MARITTYDKLRGCYVIEPDNNQNHIQRLGELEDRDEAKELVRDGDLCRCPCCGYEKNGILYSKADCNDVGIYWFNFCQNCGQRLKWGEDDSND